LSNTEFSPASNTRIALAIEYDGSAFNGWQKQSSPEVKTIQSTLETVLSQIADSEIGTVCAGRTDAGVHATCQVVHFDTPIDRGNNAWVRGANSLLPETIRVLWARNVKPEFHARYSATARCYYYILYLRETPSAIMAGRTTHVRESLDIPVMHEAAQALLGEQDFSVFRAAACQSNSPFRNISHASVSRQHGFVVFKVQANAFLQHMVRNIAGVLLDIGRGQHSAGWVKELIAGGDRTQSSMTAPPDGLYLVGVAYPPAFGLSSTTQIPIFLQSSDSKVL
jgi:tRNA pseudouridine38-40 synthase